MNTNSCEKYTKYIDSGIEWLGEIPEHWDRKSLKYFSNIVLGKMLTYFSFIILVPLIFAIITEPESIKAFAIAPGVVDTCMQDLIRKSDVKDFSNIEKFKNLKTSGSLFKTKDVAKQLISYCKNTNLLTELFTRIEL